MIEKEDQYLDRQPDYIARYRSFVVKRRILWIGTMVAGLAFALFSIPVVERWHAIHDESSWAPAEATVESAQVQTSHEVDRQTWKPAWIYSYSVSGKQYRNDSNDIVIGYDDTPLFDSTSHAEQAALAHPVGSQMTVYYDPREPGHSTLNRPMWSKRDWAFLALLLGCVGATAQILPSLVSQSRK